MEIVNLTMSKEMEKQIEKVEGFITPAEFIRYSLLKQLIQLRALPWPEKIELIRKRMRSRMGARGEKFDEEKELASLRRIREKLWKEKYASRS